MFGIDYSNKKWVGGMLWATSGIFMLFFTAIHEAYWQTFFGVLWLSSSILMTNPDWKVV